MKNVIIEAESSTRLAERQCKTAADFILFYRQQLWKNYVIGPIKRSALCVLKYMEGSNNQGIEKYVYLY